MKTKKLLQSNSRQRKNCYFVDVGRGVKPADQAAFVANQSNQKPFGRSDRGRIRDRCHAIVVCQCDAEVFALIQSHFSDRRLDQDFQRRPIHLHGKCAELREFLGRALKDKRVACAVDNDAPAARKRHRAACRGVRRDSAGGAPDPGLRRPAR